MKKSIKHFKQIIFSIAFLTAISAINISAATFTVTNTNDSGAGSLRQAILDANASSGTDTINFDASFNTPRTITLTSGRLLITNGGGITINGPGANLLTVSGNNQLQVFEIDDATATLPISVTMNNFSISNGAFPSASSVLGSAIGMNNAASAPATPTSSLTLNNMSITGNSTAGTNLQGTIACRRTGTVTINDSYIGGNNASPIRSGSNFGACSLVISNSTIEKNIVGGDGLIVCCFGNVAPASITVTNTTVNDNVVANNGSAFQVFANGAFNMTNTTIVRNRSIQGNAAVIYNGGSTSSPTANLTNVTIANNFSGSSGGAPTAGFATVTGSGAINIKNSIIANNYNSSGSINDFYAGSANYQLNISYSLVESVGTQMPSGIPSHPVTTANGNLPGVDPLLDNALRNNGGATKTLAPRRGSPVIDTGDPTTFPPTDQRGIARPQDGDGNGSARSDMGAMEKRLTDTVSTSYDFDGDGKADISVFRPSNGVWYINGSQSGFTGTVFGQNGDLLTPADFDADGKTDIAVFRPSAGAWYYLRSSDNSFVGMTFGQNGDIPRPADFDGDGRADINVFRPSNGAWYRLNSSSGAFVGQIFGQNGDKPLIADFDGDSKSDIAVFRPSSTGTFYWLDSSTGAFKASAFGFGTDIPTPADFDGDGKTDVAVFRASSGEWYRYNSSNAQFVGQAFGQNGDVPVTADYDGDGKADIAVFRNGDWYVLRSSNGGFTGQTFGFAADKPTPAAFIQ